MERKNQPAASSLSLFLARVYSFLACALSQPPAHKKAALLRAGAAQGIYYAHNGNNHRLYLLKMLHCADKELGATLASFPQVHQSLVCVRVHLVGRKLLRLDQILLMVAAAKPPLDKAPAAHQNKYELCWRAKYQTRRPVKNMRRASDECLPREREKAEHYLIVRSTMLKKSPSHQVCMLCASQISLHSGYQINKNQSCRAKAN